jgi:hypothetical protein
MATSGSPELWASQFPREQLPTLVSLVIDSWRTFKLQSDFLEVPITRRFCAHLRQNKDRSSHFFRIEYESHELNTEGRETGRIDLKFSHGFDEKVYFSFECKRLRINQPSGFKSLASDYVIDGMCRYFNGQYAEGLDKSGMLGYVLDGDINNAVQDVKKNIENRRKELCMDECETLCSCEIKPSTQVKKTSHRYGPKGDFFLYHIFLPCIKKNGKN